MLVEDSGELLADIIEDGCVGVYSYDYRDTYSFEELPNYFGVASTDKDQ